MTYIPSVSSFKITINQMGLFGIKIFTNPYHPIVKSYHIKLLIA